MLTEPQAPEQIQSKLSRILEHIDVDVWGNLILAAGGSRIMLTTQGDVLVEAARDHGVRSGRWSHINSDPRAIAAHLGRALYGPKGQILVTW